MTRSHLWFANHVRTSQYFTQIVKCVDTACCSRPRSSYFSLIPSRFLPPPIPIHQSEEGLKAPESRADQENHRFPSLFVSLALKWEDLLPRSTRSFKQLPFDLYCPSVQKTLVERICKVCHVYFASKVMLQKHFVLHKAVAPPPVVKIRPQRLAAKRQRELMVVIISEEREEETVESIHEDDLDLVGLTIPNEDSDNFSTTVPIFTMNQHLAQPWEEDIL